MNRIVACGYYNYVGKGSIKAVELIFGDLSLKIRAKMSTRVEQEQSQLVPIRLFNMTYTLFVFSCMIIVSSFVLLCEICRNRVKKYKEKI